VAPDRRAPEPRLYAPDQLLGRRPIRLRRRTDKIRFAAHLAVVVALVALSAWWVVPLHAFAGPVLVTLTATHGIHAGDLPVLVFLAVATRSMFAAQHLITAR
jgi:presenilin-like A22 family membrane protease